MPIVVRHDIPPQLLANVTLRAGMAQRRMQEQENQRKAQAAMLAFQSQEENRALQEKIAAAKEAGDLEQQRRLYEQYLPGLEKAREAAQHPAKGTPEYQNILDLVIAEQEARQETPEQAGLKAGAIATAQENAKLAAAEAKYEREMTAIDDAVASGEIDPQMAADARRRKLDAKLPPPREPTIQEHITKNTVRVGNTVLGVDATGKVYGVPIQDTEAQTEAKNERQAAQKLQQKELDIATVLYKQYTTPTKDGRGNTVPGMDSMEAVKKARSAAYLLVRTQPAPTDVIGGLIVGGMEPSDFEEPMLAPAEEEQEAPESLPMAEEEVQPPEAENRMVARHRKTGRLASIPQDKFNAQEWELPPSE